MITLDRSTIYAGDWNTVLNQYQFFDSFKKARRLTDIIANSHDNSVVVLHYLDEGGLYIINRQQDFENGVVKETYDKQLTGDIFEKVSIKMF